MLFLCAFLSVHDITAHNPAAIFSAALNICRGYIAVANPFERLFSGATALTVGEHNHHYVVDTSDAIILAERFYYEQRKSALEKIKHELVTIKNGLETIHGLNSTSFTYQFLHRHTYDAVKSAQIFSIAQEKNLSDEQKNKLTKAREHELISLERQVQDIQFLLVLHALQLIDNVGRAQAAYDDAFANIQEAIDVWNSNLNAMTRDIALRTYKSDLLQEYLLHNMHQAIDELIFIAEYCRVCKVQSIQEITTIVLAFNYIIPVINEKKQWLLQQESCVRNNITIAERYFAERAISVIALKNQVQKEFVNKHKEREAQVLQKIEMELVNSGFPDGPKKDDDEGKEKKIEIYEKNAAHIFRNEAGHLPLDTPANRKLLIDVASDSKNFLGKCKYGNEWYGKILDNGQQVWVSMRNCFIRNGGLNKIPHNFNGETGLSRLIK